MCKVKVVKINSVCRELSNVVYLYQGRIVEFSTKELKIIFSLLKNCAVYDIAAFLKSSCNDIHHYLNIINNKISACSCFQAGSILFSVIPRVFLPKDLQKIKFLSRSHASGEHCFLYRDKWIRLSDVDLRVSALLTSGEKPKDIAADLGLSVSTIYRYITKINRKFGFGNKYIAGSVFTKIAQEAFSDKRELISLSN